ncbi:MAG: hypothetical protein COB66_09110, partial [Coxiella sp. (in: Bacteria)]
TIAAPLCFYPMNAVSEGRTNCGCGPDPDPSGPPQPLTCPNPITSVGICPLNMTADTYISTQIHDINSCSISPKMASSLLPSIMESKAMSWKGDMNWNEVVLRQWAGVNDVDIPLTAFYYYGGASYYNTIKSVADYYYKSTSTWMPIVVIDQNELLKGRSGTPFSCPIPDRSNK